MADFEFKNWIGDRTACSVGKRLCRMTMWTLGIRTMTDDDRLQVTVSHDSSVPELKEKIGVKTGVLADRQRLIFQGKVLDNSESLASYSITDGVTLHMVERMLNIATPVESPPRNSSPDQPRRVVMVGAHLNSDIFSSLMRHERSSQLSSNVSAMQNAVNNIRPMLNSPCQWETPIRRSRFTMLAENMARLQNKLSESEQNPEEFVRSSLNVIEDILKVYQNVKVQNNQASSSPQMVQIVMRGSSDTPFPALNHSNSGSNNLRNSISRSNSLRNANSSSRNNRRSEEPFLSSASAGDFIHQIFGSFMGNTRNSNSSSASQRRPTQSNSSNSSTPRRRSKRNREGDDIDSSKKRK